MPWDACIAMALTSGVVLPDMCGLGGDAFLLYYDAKTQKITAMNGSGGAPAKATIEYYQSLGLKSVPKDGMLSVTVPGAVDVYFEALKQFGTLSFADHVKMLLNYQKLVYLYQKRLPTHAYRLSKMCRFKNLKNLYLKDGKPYPYGELVYNKDYAKSLRYLKEHGRDGFYKGKLADKIVEYSHEHGGFLKSLILKIIIVKY